MSTTAPVGVLADRWASDRLRGGLLVLGGAGLTGALAQVSIPIPGTPVPLTLQTLGVLLSAAALGSGRGLLSQALYVAAGFAGVPWFAGHSSGLHMPTLGYLIGFIASAWLVGRLAERGTDRSFWTTAGTMLLGNAVIYACGVPVLAHVIGASYPEAVAMGVLPFLVGDGLKILAAASLLPAAWALGSKREW